MPSKPRDGARPAGWYARRDPASPGLAWMLALLAFGAATAHPPVRAQSAPAASAPVTRSAAPDIRYIVIHRPGPAWMAGKGIFEQAGVREHVEHYRQWLRAGKLEYGGPHLDAKAGGMMIPVAGLSEREITQFADADPAVKSGLLVAEVRPWLIGMSASSPSRP